MYAKKKDGYSDNDSEDSNEDEDDNGNNVEKRKLKKEIQNILEYTKYM